MYNYVKVVTVYPLAPHVIAWSVLSVCYIRMEFLNWKKVPAACTSLNQDGGTD